MKVTVGRTGELISIAVEDDGRGFEPRESAPAGDGPGGFGLLGIRERLSLLGGHVEIESELGRGSRIVLVAPLALPHTQEGAKS